MNAFQRYHWDLAGKHADIALAALALHRRAAAEVHTDAAVHHYQLATRPAPSVRPRKANPQPTKRSA